MSADLYPASTLAALGQALRAAKHRIALIVNPSEGESELGAQLADAARAVHEGTDKAVSMCDDVILPPTPRPAIHVVADGRLAVHYLAAPVNEEAPPFLDLLYGLATGADAGRHGSELATLASTCELLVLTSPGCPNCPHAVRVATTIAAASHLVTTTVVDATRFPELAERYHVRSVPTTVIDDGLGVVGVPTIKQLVRHILDRGTPEHERQSFRSMVHGGRFAAAAERLLDGNAHTHFLQLWHTSTMEERIGLTLAAEEALDRVPGALDAMVPALVESLQQGDAARRGDTADLLAKIGDQRARPALESLAADPDSELAEAAADALEDLLQSRRANDSHGQ